MRVLIALSGICGCLAAVAFGADEPLRASMGGASRQQGEQASGSRDREPRSGLPPRPRITLHPRAPVLSTSARFGFADPAPRVRFECKLDDGRWRMCRTPAAFIGLAVGSHAFSVRAISRQGKRSATTRFHWKLLEPKPFSIVPQLAGLGELYPGAPAVGLPVEVQNPNPVPIFVTDLEVAVGADPVGCPSADNLALGPSNASSSTPLRVPAGRSASLPAQGISPPAIQL